MTARAGSLLASARRERQLTQRQVARAADVSVSYPSKLEAGTEPVAPPAARRLAPVLGLKAADLLALPRQDAARRAVPPLPASLARSLKDIPRTCPCDWLMTFRDRRPSGWRHVKAKPRCPHHGGGR